MAGKYMVETINRRYYETKGYDTLDEAVAEAKRRLSYDTDSDRDIFVTQQLVKIERPAVENAITTTL